MTGRNVAASLANFHRLSVHDSVLALSAFCAIFRRAALLVAIAGVEGAAANPPNARISTGTGAVLRDHRRAHAGSAGGPDRTTGRLRAHIGTRKSVRTLAIAAAGLVDTSRRDAELVVAAAIRRHVARFGDRPDTTAAGVSTAIRIGIAANPGATDEIERAAHHWAAVKQARFQMRAETGGQGQQQKRTSHAVHHSRQPADCQFGSAPRKSGKLILEG